MIPPRRALAAPSAALAAFTGDPTVDIRARDLHSWVPASRCAAAGTTAGARFPLARPTR